MRTGISKSRLWCQRSKDGCLQRWLFKGIHYKNKILPPRYKRPHSKWKYIPSSHASFQELVNPLPKERWNSTAASCSSNTIGPLCSDVIEKNWDFCTAFCWIWPGMNEIARVQTIYKTQTSTICKDISKDLHLYLSKLLVLCTRGWA